MLDFLSLRLNLFTPSYRQICLRNKELQKALNRLSNRLQTDIVFDSTGLKVYGEGEMHIILNDEAVPSIDLRSVHDHRQIH